ncbi:unnamed protein product, partial [Schistosoma bovis]
YNLLINIYVDLSSSGTKKSNISFQSENVLINDKCKQKCRILQFKSIAFGFQTNNYVKTYVKVLIAI